METNNQLVKVINASGVEKATAASLEIAFTPFCAQLTEWSEKAKTLVVTDEKQTREMKMAREARLALKDIRVAANKTRIALKEDSTRYGKAVQSVYNLIEGLIVPTEKHFEEQEKFVEIKEQKRKDALKKVREVELIPYQEFVSPSTFNELGEYTEKEYETILTGCKLQLQNKIKEEAKAKEEKTRLEKEKVERQGKMYELGLKWNGSEFCFKDINFHWTDLICMTAEEFDKAYVGAKARKAELDAELVLEQLYESLEKPSFPSFPKMIMTIPEPVSTIISRIKPTSDPRLFHCFLCGSELVESRLGFYECDNCFSTFLPSLDREGNQCFTCIK